METYSEFRPTAMDPRGLGLGDRQDWLVAPVSRTRDSGALAESNFETVLRDLGGESEDVEVHRFGHWGPGWFEIILVKPDTRAALLAAEWESTLEEYPVADEFDLGARESEEAQETWSYMGLRARVEHCKRYRVSIFAARRDDAPYSNSGYEGLLNHG